MPITIRPAVSCLASLDGELDEISLLGGRAFAADHIVAVALEPLRDLLRRSESLRVGGRRKRLDGLAGGDVLARGIDVLGVACRTARHILGHAPVLEEQSLATLGGRNVAAAG